MPVVAGLGVAIGAIVALLICYGALYLGKMLSRMLPSHINTGAVSIPFGSLLESAIDSALAGIQWVFGKWVLPAVAFVARPVIAMLGWIGSVTRFAITAAVQLQWLTFTALPQVLSSAKGWALAQVSALRADVVAIYSRLHSLAYHLYRVSVTYAKHLYDDLHALAYHLYRVAVTYTRTLVAAEVAGLTKSIGLARTHADDVGRAVRSDLGKLINRVEGQIAGITATTAAVIDRSVSIGVAQAEAYASTAVAASIRDLTTDVDQALDQVFDGLIIDVGALEGVIATDLPDIGAAVRAIPKAIPTDIAGAIALPLTVAIPMLRYMRECGIPNCRNLGGLGRFLSDLLGAAELGALLAMITEMIQDPEGAARNTAEELGDVLSGAVGLAEDLLGV